MNDVTVPVKQVMQLLSQQSKEGCYCPNKVSNGVTVPVKQVMLLLSH